MLKNTKSENKLKGSLGEKLVCVYLDRYGYEIIEKNYRCTSGEVDVIFKDKLEIVFAEIKTRTSVEFGNPAEAVDLKKRKHILNVARYYLYTKSLFENPVRFDVIEVYFNKDKPIINHIKNAFCE